jgi:hypothetical protein
MILPLILLLFAFCNFGIHLMIVPAQNAIIEYEEIALNWALIICTALNLQLFLTSVVPEPVEIIYTLVFAIQSFFFPYLLRYFMTVRVWNKLITNSQTNLESQKVYEIYYLTEMVI